MSGLDELIEQANEDLAAAGLPITVVGPQVRAIEGCYQCGGSIAPGEGSVNMRISDGDDNLIDMRTWHFDHYPRDMKAYIAADWPLAAQYWPAI